MLICATLQTAAGSLEIEVFYIEQLLERPAVLSRLVSYPDDEGLAGARLGIADNNTTGKFLKHKYSLTQVRFDDVALTVEGAREILARGAVLAVVNAEADVLVQIADLPEAQDDLLFNARDNSIVLRNEQCRANLLHTTASRAMLADALMQFLSKRQWRSLFLVEGTRADDQLFASALKNSAKKFGLKIRHQKQWLADADMRRNAAQEIPVFTQEKQYDVIIVADEAHDFSQFMLYNTWLPRPIAGSAGLQPLNWAPVLEQWGALQLQTRFDELAGRSMNQVDYANWAALRSIGEAVTRTGESSPAAIRAFLLSQDFALAAFKGRKMSFRNWNGQLRQPVPLVHGSAMVAMAPLEGFLHQYSELDTLGIDLAESLCMQFGK